MFRLLQNPSFMSGEIRPVAAIEKRYVSGERGYSTEASPGIE